MDSVDLRGKPCPIPVIETKKLLSNATAGTVITVRVDNDIARQNLQKMAEGEGYAFSFESTAADNILVTVTAGKGCKIITKDVGGLVVAIGGDCMGRGSDELGATLMKSFIFSLTEQDSAPEHILFFNSGIHLACAGSAALDDLAVLAKKGVTINSCGACLNYYQKTDQLKIGGVTNMFAIVQTMAQARKLINL